MIDVKQHFIAELTALDCAVPFAVKPICPKTWIQGNLVVCNELCNTTTALEVADDVAVQLDIYAKSMEELWAISAAISDRLLQIGWKRQFASPDSLLPEPGGYLRKTYRYGRKVDLRTNRLID